MLSSGRRIRTAGLCGFVSLVVVAITAGCYTSLPADEPLPLMVERRVDGSFAITFRVCPGEALTAAGVEAKTRGGSQTLVQGDPKVPVADASDLTMVLSDATLSSGEMIPSLPLLKEWATLPVPRVGDLTLVSIHTSGHIAQVDPRDFGDAAGPWLVTHAPGHFGENTVKEVDASVARAAVGATCLN